MDRVAVFVDAGYLFAQGSILISGGPRTGARPLPRGHTRLDEAAAVKFLEQLALTAANLPLLRIYWYDGTNAGPTPVHNSLAFRNNIKVRLGIVNAFGEQKGVDSLIITDLINLSRNRAMSDAVLLTGDEDIRVGVQQAQELGVRVHLVGLETASTNQSNLLRQEADTLHEVTAAEVATFLTLVTPPAPIATATTGTTTATTTTPTTPTPRPTPLAAPGPRPPTTASPRAPLDVVLVAETLANGLPKPDVDRVVRSPHGVPNDIDRQLLMAGAAACKGSLTEQEKRDLRREFVDACKRRP